MRPEGVASRLDINKGIEVVEIGLIDDNPATLPDEEVELIIVLEVNSNTLLSRTLCKSEADVFPKSFTSASR